MNLLLLTAICLLLGADPAGNVRPKDQPKASVSTERIEAEYVKIIEDDEKALNEIQRLIKEADDFAAQGDTSLRATLSGKIEQQIAPIRKKYKNFLERNPKHVEAGLAYGSFLNEIGETEEAIDQWEKVREAFPNEPAAWNNLANVYGHIGPVKKAFHYYEKAMRLDPSEPVYVQNMATTVYLFRRDAMEMYRINEEEVFKKALDLYRLALKLDPTNLVLATDFAQSYYGIKPLRTDEALNAWNQALSLATNDLEKEGIYLHLARVELNSGMFEQAQKHLDMVKQEEMKAMKARLQRNINEKKMAAPPNEKAKVL